MSTALTPDIIESIIMKAGDGTRTRDSKLGKLALYQLSYTRKSFIHTNSR